MAETPRINLPKLKRDIIECTGPGKQFTRRSLSLRASGGRNPDLVRDLISRGQDKQPTVEAVAGLAEAMGKSPQDYMESQTSAAKEMIWVIAQVQAGVWREQSEWPEEDRYQVQVDPGDYPEADRFGLEMVGNSMERVIHDGSILDCYRVFGPGSPIPRSGNIVVVERHQGILVETTCKRLEILHDGTYVLRAESDRPEFAEPILISKPDPDSFSDDSTRIIAIVNEARKRFL